MCLVTCLPVAENDIFESIAGHPVAVVLKLYNGVFVYVCVCVCVCVCCMCVCVCVCCDEYSEKSSNSLDQCGTQNDRIRHTWM